MRPIADLAAHAQALRGIFCDVDDTLTLDGVVVPAAYAQIAAAVAAGLRVVTVTGRPAGYGEVMAATWPLDGAIAENGAIALRRAPGPSRKAAAIEHLYWDGDAATRAEQRRRLDALAAAVQAELPTARLADDQWLRVCDLAFDVGERQKLDRASIDAITARIVAAGARVLISSVHAHAFYGDHDKARMCVRAARDWWGVDLDAERNRWLFVGDSLNDQACFAYFPLSAGVANVRPWLDRLAPPPAFIADGEGGVGFAEIVAVLLRARAQP
jgi:hydroxymethylpyrimidine pyrophosphatase-like HAD family hydrolase